jgi:hypothetical protein
LESKQAVKLSNPWRWPCHKCTTGKYHLWISFCIGWCGIQDNLHVEFRTIYLIRYGCLLGCRTMYMYEFTDVSEVCTTPIIRVLLEAVQYNALMMEAVQTSETLVNLYQCTQCYNSDDCHLYTYRCENFKSDVFI